MRNKSLIKTTTDPGGESVEARNVLPRSRRPARTDASGALVVPPLQWWRHLTADVYTTAHLQTLHRAIAGIGMIGEPRWADAARGEPAAAVALALRAVNDRRSPRPVVDLHMSTVLIAAVAGDTAAITLLTVMIGRMAASEADRERLQRSWSKAKRIARQHAVNTAAKSGGVVEHRILHGRDDGLSDACRQRAPSRRARPHGER